MLFTEMLTEVGQGAVDTARPSTERWDVQVPVRVTEPKEAAAEPRTHRGVPALTGEAAERPVGSKTGARTSPGEAKGNRVTGGEACLWGSRGGVRQTGTRATAPGRGGGAETVFEEIGAENSPGLINRHPDPGSPEGSESGDPQSLTPRRLTVKVRS